MTDNYAKQLNIGISLDLTFLESYKAKLLDPTKGFMWVVDKSEIDQTLLNFLHGIDLTVFHFEIFYAAPNKPNGTNIHADQTLDNHCKINFVFGGQGSVMNWYLPKPNQQPTSNTSIGNTPALRFTKDEVDLVYSAQLCNGIPWLVNVGVPHNVTNAGTEPRWCLSYVLKERKAHHLLQWQDAEPILRPWFIQS